MTFQNNRVFLDTSFAIALAVVTDLHHTKAAEIAAGLRQSGTSIITIRSVLLEIGNALSRPRFRRSAVELLKQMESDSSIEVCSLSEELYSKGFKLFATRPDKEWGLVDCISFVVITERGIAEALAADEHFVQAGFRALLRE